MKTTEGLEQIATQCVQTETVSVMKKVFHVKNHYWAFIVHTVLITAWLMSFIINISNGEMSTTTWLWLVTAVLCTGVLVLYCIEYTHTNRRAIIVDGSGICLYECGVRVEGENEKHLSEAKTVEIAWADIDVIYGHCIVTKDGTTFSDANAWKWDKSHERNYYNDARFSPFGRKVWTEIEETFDTYSATDR